MSPRRGPVARPRTRDSVIFSILAILGAFETLDSLATATTEKDALWTFRGGMSSFGSSMASWDYAADHCASWDGVRCNEQGNVYELDLRSGGLVSGAQGLSAELSVLTTLSQLYLQSNNLKGTLPPEYSAWNSLTKIALYSNALTGTLPKAYSTWTNLQFIQLYTNSLSGTLPPSYSTWTSLKIWYIFGNQISGVLPKEWSTMTSLSFLYISNNQLTGSVPSAWSTLANIRTMILSYNELTGAIPSTWSTMTSITSLAYEKNKFCPDTSDITWTVPTLSSAPQNCNSSPSPPPPVTSPPPRSSPPPPSPSPSPPSSPPPTLSSSPSPPPSGPSPSSSPGPSPPPPQPPLSPSPSPPPPNPPVIPPPSFLTPGAGCSILSSLQSSAYSCPEGLVDVIGACRSSADCGEGNICWIQTGNAADDSCQGECRQREETCQDDEIAAMFSWVPAVEAADSTRCQGCMQTSREMPVLEGLGCIHNALLCSHVEGTLSNDSTEGLLKMLSWLAGWLQGPVIACGTLDVHLDALDVVLGLGSDELSVISNVIAALRMSATRLFHILPESLREEAQLILQLLGKAETSLQRVLPLRDASLFGTCNPMLDSMETKRTIGEALLQNVAPGESVQIRSDQGTMTVVSLKDKDANINLTDVRSGGSTVRPSVKLTLIEACKAVPGLCPDQLLVILTYTYRMAYLMLALPPRVLAAAVLAYGMDVPDGFAVGLVSGQISIQIPGLENIMYRDFVVQQPPSRRMMLDAYVAAVSYSFPLPPTAVIEMAFPLDQQMMLAAAAGSPNRPVFCSRIFYAPSLGLEVIGMANLSDDRMSASCETNSTGEFVVVMVSPLASMGRGASVRYTSGRWAADVFVPSPDVNLRDGYARTVKLLEGLTIGVAFVVLGSMFLWGCAPPNQCSKFGSDDSQEELDEEEPFLNHMLYPLAKPYNNTPLQPSITPTSQGPSTWDSVEAFQESPQETSALTGVPRAEPAKGGLGGRERSSDCALTEQHKGEARPGKETSSLRNVSLEMGTELCGGAGKTPLHLEVARGNLVKVKSITKYAAKMGIIDSVIGARDELGRTPLHSAASMGDEACVRIMLSQLTFPKSGSNFRDMLQGRSILPGVSEGDTRSLASYINDQDSAGNTMLHLAAAKGHSGVIRALQDLAREGGQHLNDALRNAGGLTPLQVAAINGRVKAVSQLLTTRTAVELQEDVNSDSEEEALEDAPSHKQSRQTIPLASTAGPDPETSVSRHSALHLAAMYGHVRVVRALLKYLANGALDMTLDGFMALNQAEAWEQEGSWAWQRSKVDL